MNDISERILSFVTAIIAQYDSENEVDPRNVSLSTRRAQEITLTWQNLCKNEFPGLNSKNEMLFGLHDCEGGIVYELKLSPNNPRDLLYKTICKAMAHNHLTSDKRRFCGERKKIEKIYFIVHPTAQRKLTSGYAADVCYAAKKNLSIEIEIIPYGVPPYILK